MEDVLTLLASNRKNLFEKFGCHVDNCKWDHIIDACEDMTADMEPILKDLGITDEKCILEFCNGMEDILAALMFKEE